MQVLGVYPQVVVMVVQRRGPSSLACRVPYPQFCLRKVPPFFTMKCSAERSAIFFALAKFLVATSLQVCIYPRLVSRSTIDTMYFIIRTRRPIVHTPRNSPTRAVLACTF